MSERRRPVPTALSLRAWLRQVGDSPSVPIALAVATFVTAGCLSIAPRIVEHASEADLDEELADAGPAERNIRIVERTRIGVISTGDPLEPVRRRGRDLIDDAPESVQSVVAGQRFVVDSPRFEVTSYPDEVRGPYPTTFQFRHQEGLEDHLTLVEGDLPASQPTRQLLRGDDCPPDVPAEDYRPDPDEDADCGIVTAPVFDTLLTADTAEALRLDVGGELILFADPRDGLWQRARGQQFGRRYIMRVAGLVELSDPGLEYWFGDDMAHRARISESPPPSAITMIDATGLLLTEQYQEYLRATVSVPSTFEWRYPVDLDAVTSGGAARLAEDLDRFAPPGADVLTQLPDLLVAHLDQRSLTVGLMSAIVSGVFASTAGGLAALAVLGASRHRSSARRVLERGATRRQLALDAMRTAALPAVPAAAAGWIAARIALPDTGDAATVWLALAAPAMALACITAATLDGVRHGSIGRTGDRRPVSRRIVAEVVVVVLTVGAVLLLRRRGAISAPDAARDLDPLLSVAAVLAALTIALVVVRLARPATTAVARSTARRRGGVGFVGTQRALAENRAMSWPLIVMVGAVAIASFATTVGGSIERTQQARSWTLVGGDFRISTYNSALSIGSLTGSDEPPVDVDVAAGVIIDDVSAVGPTGATFTELTALGLSAYLDTVADDVDDAVDLDALETLQAATELWDPSGDAPMPAIVSTRWPASTVVRVGDVFTMNLGGTGSQEYEAVDRAETAAGIEPNRPWVLVDLAALSTRIDRTPQPNLLVGRADTDELSALAKWIAPDADAISLRSRYVVFDQVAGDPFSTWVGRTLTAVTLLAGAVAILAAVAAFEISAARRDRDLSVLRTLGLSRRQSIGVVAVEQAPTVTIAIVLGSVGGLAIAEALHPALRLGRLAGVDAAVSPSVDPARIGLVAAALTAAVGAAIAVAVWRLVHRNDGSMLRTGDDR